MMTLQEMQSAVCKKLPELVGLYSTGISGHWLTNEEVKTLLPCDYTLVWKVTVKSINWPTEGLQICHEAEKLLTAAQSYTYYETVRILVASHANERGVVMHGLLCHDMAFTAATYEQRLEALCRVWFPERFEKE